MSGRNAARAVAVALLIVAFACPAVTAWQSPPDDRSEKATGLLEAAVAALGGPRYLAVTGISSKGVYTPFSKGHATFPVEFEDVLVLPDKNRTDFGKKKNRIVQVNTGETGWKFDGPRGLLERVSPEDVRSFKIFVRGTIDNLLRSGWRDPGVKLRYSGREELQPRQWVEVVVIDFPDGFSAQVLIDPATSLPVASRHEAPEANEVSEARYHHYVDYDGLKVPRVVDLYKNGVQTGRVVYDVVRFNPSVPPSFFDMPADVKSLTR